MPQRRSPNPGAGNASRSASWVGRPSTRTDRSGAADHRGVACGTQRGDQGVRPRHGRLPVAAGAASPGWRPTTGPGHRPGRAPAGRPGRRSRRRRRGAPVRAAAPGPAPSPPTRRGSARRHRSPGAAGPSGLDPVRALVRQDQPAVRRGRHVVRVALDGRGVLQHPGPVQLDARPDRPPRPGRRRSPPRRTPGRGRAGWCCGPASRSPGTHTPRSASPTSADRMIKWLSSRGIRSAPSPDTSITKPDRRTVRSTCSRQSRASPRQSKPGPRLALVADTATVTVRPTSTARPTLVSLTPVSRPVRRPTRSPAGRRAPPRRAPARRGRGRCRCP